jgi:FHA domain
VAPLTCPHCRAEVSPGATLCWRCSGEIAVRPPVRPGEPTGAPTGVSTAAPPGAPTGAPPAPAPVIDPTVEPAPAAELVFPTGIVPVPAPGGHLLIGREQAAVRDHLAGYTNVSRRHAEVYRSAAGVFVVDADSLNGTYVNDEKLAPARPRQLADGDEIRFARNAAAIVRITP